MTTKLPVILIIPGAGQNPSHYGYLSHLLQKAGYPIVSALLPSIGASPKVTVSDDSNYIRDKLLLPILDHQEHDVIMLMHSYGSVPGSAAARGLSKTNRAKQGKSTGVIGQVYLAALLIKGGDEKSVMDAFGGQYPPHVRPDVCVFYSNNLESPAH